MSYRLPELPFEPEYWPGSDEWTEMMDSRRHYYEERRLYEAEELFDEPLR